jgi:hypothetical protein
MSWTLQDFVPIYGNILGEYAFRLGSARADEVRESRPAAWYHSVEHKQINQREQKGTYGVDGAGPLVQLRRGVRNTRLLRSGSAES